MIITTIYYLLSGVTFYKLLSASGEAAFDAKALVMNRVWRAPLAATLLGALLVFGFNMFSCCILVKYAGVGNNGRSQNLFSYRIRVTNLRTEPIQVMGREWTIKNDQGTEVVHVTHVPGNAIVGPWAFALPPTALQIAVLEGGRPSRTFMAAVAPFAHLRPDMQRP
ncbi:hypothetical protein TSOC_010904 [Tetrabaena socialis]|uniref:ApaG domain-containing protein n=1 Tax=Tetrabaena socialis TaxID=47790 RepID=A0A2J7ZS26_9CHLO|nr:hypothetical protein TSOC_010904 [Tetrabaena socialis]|eukprot:PNH03071.1 hypothetical protein TSOC_010904 [Tetrabaena socialis]